MALLLWLLRQKKMDGSLTLPNDMKKVVVIQKGVRTFVRDLAS